MASGVVKQGFKYSPMNMVAGAFSETTMDERAQAVGDFAGGTVNGALDTVYNPNLAIDEKLNAGRIQRREDLMASQAIVNEMRGSTYSQIAAPLVVKSPFGTIATNVAAATDSNNSEGLQTPKSTLGQGTTMVQRRPGEMAVETAVATFEAAAIVTPAVQAGSSLMRGRFASTGGQVAAEKTIGSSAVEAPIKGKVFTQEELAAYRKMSDAELKASAGAINVSETQASRHMAREHVAASAEWRKANPAAWNKQLAERKAWLNSESPDFYNITSDAKYPTIGRDGTFVSPATPYKQTLGNLEGRAVNGEVRVSMQEALKLDNRLGLDGALTKRGADGAMPEFTVRKFGSDIMRADSPGKGIRIPTSNDLSSFDNAYLGPNNGLPTGVPEMKTRISLPKDAAKKSYKIIVDPSL